MATMKKKRQKLTMGIKKALGVSLPFARQIAREILDRPYKLNVCDMSDHPEVLSYDYNVDTTIHRFYTKRGVLSYHGNYDYFDFRSTNVG